MPNLFQTLTLSTDKFFKHRDIFILTTKIQMHFYTQATTHVHAITGQWDQSCDATEEAGHAVPLAIPSFILTVN